MNPRDDLAGVVDVGRPDGVVRNQRAVFAQDIHHRGFVVVHGVGNEVFKTVGHVAILGVWSNGFTLPPIETFAVRKLVASAGCGRCSGDSSPPP